MVHRVVKFFAKQSLLLMVGGLPYAHAEPLPPAFATCVACHGDQGQGNDALKAPTLAGQFDWYLDRQLHNFQRSLRGSHVDDSEGQQMRAMSLALSEDDISALSQYLASLPPATAPASSHGDLKNGSRYYQARCGACHGGEAQGNEAFNAPRLNTLSPDYIARQMAHFSDGLRGTQKEDKWGRQMAMMAKTVSGKELDDIIFFITQHAPAMAE